MTRRHIRGCKDRYKQLLSHFVRPSFLMLKAMLLVSVIQGKAWVWESFWRPSFQMGQVWRTGFQSFCILVGSTANGLARTSLSGGLPQFLFEASWPSNVPAMAAMATFEAKILASWARQLSCVCSCVYTVQNQHETSLLKVIMFSLHAELQGHRAFVPHLLFLKKLATSIEVPDSKDPLTKWLHAPQMLEAGNFHENLTETPLTWFAYSSDLATNPASHTPSTSTTPSNTASRLLSAHPLSCEALPKSTSVHIQRMHGIFEKHSHSVSEDKISSLKSIPTAISATAYWGVRPLNIEHGCTSRTFSLNAW